ncbi:MAG: cation/multidrug efflux pump [Pseudomonadota bacterium]|nr:MAG: cation/multidrug efflux pump [Pseudomonadota bacterium]
MILEIVTATALIAGAILVVLGARQLLRRRPLRASLQGLSGGLLLALGALVASMALNLHTYQRLTGEQAVAEVRFEEVTPQKYQTYVIEPDNEAQVFVLRGDEWQLDARILKWHGVATLLGMDTVYRLDRLAGRYRSVRQERNALRTIYELGTKRGLDVWKLANEHGQRLPWVDAVYGSATYLPMAHDARFAVSASTSGLVARPLNESARQAIERWR